VPNFLYKIRCEDQDLADTTMPLFLTWYSIYHLWK